MTKEAAQRSIMRRMALAEVADSYAGMHKTAAELDPIFGIAVAGKLPPRVQPTIGAPSYAHPNDPSRKPTASGGPTRLPFPGTGLAARAGLALGQWLSGRPRSIQQP